MICRVQRATVTSSNHISLEPYDFDLDNWNRGYNFTGVMKHLSITDPRLVDPTFTVFQAPLSQVTTQYHHFTVPHLSDLARAHLLPYSGKRKDVLYDDLSSHQCTISCISTLYVFKQRTTLRPFQLWAHQGRESDNTQVNTDPPDPLSTPALNVIPSVDVQWNQAHALRSTMGRDGSHWVEDRRSRDPEETTSNASMRSWSSQKAPAEPPAFNADSDPREPSVSHLDPIHDALRSTIIKEWQEEMDLKQFIRKPCAVCSTLTHPPCLTKIHGNELNLALLQNDELPDHVLPVSYNFVAYSRAILDPAGLDDRTRLGIMNICKLCLADLSRQLMPKFALANWLYYARDRLPQNVREAFSQMSIFEKSLICRVRTNSILCRFTGIDEGEENGLFRSKRRHIKGNIISTPLDVHQVNHLLPPSESDIGDTVCAILVASQPPTAATIDKLHPILVRKSRVKLLIEFLLENNPHYRVCETFAGYSPERLDALFGGSSDIGVPASVRIGYLPSNEAVESAVSDYIGRLDGLEGLFMENVAYTLGDHTGASYREMTLRALQHCKDKKPFLSHRSGSTPVPDISNPNWLSWSHPNADPFGIGGFHHPRRKRPIGMEQQLRHLLEVHDPFFESDPELAFDVYNIVQKSAVNTSLRFRVPYTSYARVVNEICKMDKTALGELRQQFQRNPNYQPVSEEEKKILRVMSSISPVAHNVPGSVAQRIKMRNEIRAMIGQRGSPTLFVTLNPSDYYHPLVTVLANRCSTREEVDELINMTATERTSTALQHPMACAQFFDIMIKRFIRTGLRYRRSRSKGGIFGICDAYYGTVETQGRGSLHCHMLIWLRGHLPPETLAKTLRSSQHYRDRLTSWLDSITDSGFIGSREHLNLSSSFQVREELGMPEIHPATVPGPLAARLEADAFQVAMNNHIDDLLLWFNWHNHSGTCWKYLRPGEPRVDENCRFGMDGTIIPSTTVDPEEGSIRLRRRHPKMTHYNPTLTFLMKCNTDIKFIGSGEDAKAFMYYVTDYITKAPLSMHAGLTALSYAIKQGTSKGVLNGSEATMDDSRRAMTIAVNSMLGNQEISHPQVMSFILGGGEKYTSEKFSTINWGEVKRYVEKGIDDPTSEAILSINQPVDHDDLVMSVTADEGHLDVSNQLLDYIYRPQEGAFNTMGLYRHLSSTIKVTHPKSSSNPPPSNNQPTPFPFLNRRHPQYRTHMLKLRTTDLTPVLLGPRIARRHGSETERERWAQDICILFKPWRLPTDLNHDQGTWYEHLQSLLPSMAARDVVIIDNLSLLAEAKQARDERPRRTRRETHLRSTIDAALEEAIQGQSAPSQDDANIFGLLALDTSSSHAGESHSIPDRLTTLIGPDASNAFGQCLQACQTSFTIEELGSLATWEDVSEERASLSIAEQATFMSLHKGRGVPKNVQETPTDENPTSPSRTPGDLSRAVYPPSAIVTSIRETFHIGSSSSIESQWDAAIRLMDTKGVSNNPEQRRAFSIIAHHVIEGGPQLLMYIGGRGGSGKSYLIETMVELFQLLEREDELRMGALTGIAASLIGGNTLHSLLGIGPRQRQQTSERLAAEWRKVKYLVIDETSMIGAQFLSTVSSRLKMAKSDVSSDCTKMLGGLNVIFTGDFHQLAPPKQPSLFSHRLIKNPTFLQTRNNDGVDAIAGAYLWRQVPYVVLLKQNKRQGDDPILAELLDYIRTGSCLDKNGRTRLIQGLSVMDHLRTRDMAFVAKQAPDTLQLFVDAPVIVGSKTLRDVLNACLLSSHARRLGQAVHIYYSRDSVHRQKATGNTATYLWNLPARQTDDSLGQLPLFVGMKVMITENISVAFRVVNGSEGIVQDIRYSTNEDGRRLVDVVYVKIQNCNIHVPGLMEGVVPIFPTSISVAHPVTMGEIRSRSFRRQQVPLAPAYSYTDYKSQGRTLDRAIIDLTSSRGQGIYVMLSRVKTLQGLLILRWFPDNKILQRMSGELRDEIARLDALDLDTTALYNSGTLAPSPANPHPLRVNREDDDHALQV